MWKLVEDVCKERGTELVNSQENPEAEGTRRAFTATFHGTVHLSSESERRGWMIEASRGRLNTGPLNISNLGIRNAFHEIVGNQHQHVAREY